MVVLPAVFFRACSAALVRSVSVIVLMVSVLAVGVTAQADDERQLLDENEYRSKLEEVVVIGKEPEWRKEKKEEWRPDRFKLQAPSSTSRFQWFPRYTKDERDNYDGVRDRTGEKPEIQIFNWKF